MAHARIPFLGWNKRVLLHHLIPRESSKANKLCSLEDLYVTSSKSLAGVFPSIHLGASLTLSAQTARAYVTACAHQCAAPSAASHSC